MKKEKIIPKIVVPINKYDELEVLHQSGADEFYGGYVPDYWIKEYPYIFSPNGRTFNEAQVISIFELKQILDYCKINKMIFSLTLNAPMYLKDQYPLLEKIIEEYLAIGGKHLIVADIALISLINEKKYPVEMHVGTNGVILNHYTAEFYSDLGIKRMILSRQLTIDEISKIVQKEKETKFDVFMLIGKCPNIEGLCNFLHDSPDRIWHCVENYKIKVKDNKEEYMFENIWAGIKRTDACGLCQVKKLMELKVYGFKIVGRGAATEKKLRAVTGLKKMIEISLDESDDDVLCQESHKIYNDIFGHKCNSRLCYFPFDDTTRTNKKGN